MRVQSRNFCKLNQGSDYQGLIPAYICFTVGDFASNIPPVSYFGYMPYLKKFVQVPQLALDGFTQNNISYYILKKSPNWPTVRICC